jgi:hypothetical protein
MPCQELSSSLTQNSLPSGALGEDARPQANGFCRSYNFAQADDLVTFFFEDPMITFAGDQIETFA